PFEGAPAVVCRASLAPAASVVEGAKYASYACLAALTSDLVQRRGLRPVLQGAAALGSGLALLTLLHALTSAQTVFGIYRPEDVKAAQAVSVLLNTNSRAAYLNLGFFCVLALTSCGREKLRAPLLAGGVLSVAMSILRGSRGRVLTLLAGPL